MQEQKPEVRSALLKGRKLTPQIEQDLKASLEFFAPQYKAT
jgi:hypothetical protein